MRKLMLSLAGILLAPTLAFGQVRAGISIDLPVVLPPMVVVQPGVQVVPECDHEVFYTGGYYWVRQDNVWYRSRSHRGGWVAAPARVVPAAIVRMPPGHYKHWRAERGPRPMPGPARPAGWDRDDRRYEHDRRHDHDRDHDDDHDHGHGHGHGRGHEKHGDRD
jgi:hypothetical protein